MAQQVIDVGTSASDGTGDPLREAFTKINDNFTELYTTVDNEGLTYGNITSNVVGITFNVTRYTESYAATPVLKGTGQVVGNVYLIRGNVVGGSTPLNDVLLTVTSLANATIGNIATVSATGTPISPVLRVNGLTGNVTLTVNNIDGAASKAYVNAAIAANVANVTGTVTDSLNANITAANAVISNHTARITTLESNAATQATAITNLTNTKATISYVDTSIDVALSSNAILANVASVNANIAAANAAILLRANLSGADFSGNVSANSITSTNAIWSQTYMVVGSATDIAAGQSFANPAIIIFGNSAQNPGPNNSRYYQLNLQNLDPVGSGDLVVTANDGDDTSNYISVGVNGSQFYDPYYPGSYAHDAFVYNTGGNLSLYSNNGNVRITSGNLEIPQVTITAGNLIYLQHGTKIVFSDGTVQSTAFGGNANVTSINANITAANIAISALQSNATAQALELDSLLSNAAAQATILNVLSSNASAQATAIELIAANIGSYQTYANAQLISISVLNANLVAANLNIATLTTNAASQALELNNLQSNAQAQQDNIILLQSNAAAQAIQINLLNANVVAANTNIGTLSSNAATQATLINLINANVTAANLSINTLFANAAAQALDIDNIYANLNLNLANTAAANSKIIILDANVGSITNNVSVLQSNAVSQESKISLVNANITAANSKILNLETFSANVLGTIFNGNIQANYILANTTVKIGSNLEVGNTSPVSFPDLGGIFVGNVDSYYQVVVQNLNSGSSASGDFVITADNGTDDNYYLNIGINSSGWSGNFTVPAGDTGLQEFPNDGYFTCIGGNTALRSDNNTFIVANTAAIGLFKDGDLTLIRSNLRFSDNTVQQTAIIDVPGLYANIGTLSLFQSNILGNAAYTPNNAANYNGTITNIQQALDELAARLRALGG